VTPINASHEGHDQAGALTTHKGLLKNCPAPECQDRVIEQQEDLIREVRHAMGEL